MKKCFFILVLMIFICVCGKKTVVEKTVKNNINIEKDTTYKLEVVCGDKKKESYVTLNKDKSAIYSIYECNNDVFELTYGEGSYEVNDTKIILTDNYAQKINIDITSESSITINLYNIKQSLTK